MSRNDKRDARLDLRGRRAGDAFGDFCFAWLDTGRELAFGSAELLLRTADDFTAASCSPERLRDARGRRLRREHAAAPRRR